MKQLTAIFLILVLYSCKKEPTTPVIQPKPVQTVFYLDFDGHTFATLLADGGKAVEYKPVNLSKTDLDTIISEVAGDFAKYNVLITTDSTIFLKALPTKRVRAIVTPNVGWIPPANTGWSWIGSMGEKVEMPCIILADKLINNSHYISQTISHELGHTLGLFHQSTYDASCKKISEYNYGDGINAPLMGVSILAKNRGTWWKGPNATGCNVFQDDDLIITNKLGLK